MNVPEENIPQFISRNIRMLIKNYPQEIVTLFTTPTVKKYVKKLKLKR